jgi:hypothetical protein
MKQNLSMLKFNCNSIIFFSSAKLKAYFVMLLSYIHKLFITLTTGFDDMSLRTGKTKGGSITVLLTSCLTVLD